MTLSIDEVRSIRFPMARKPNEDGYRASSVDKFMDELEISYAQLVEENEKLAKNQGSAQPPASEDPRIAELGADKDRLTAEVDRLTGENQHLRGQLDQLRSTGNKSSAATQQLTAENEQLRATADQLRSQLEAAQREAAQVRAQLQKAQTTATAAPVQVGTANGTQHVVVTAADEAGPWAARLLEMSTKEADQLVAEAKQHADELRQQVQAETEQQRAQAKTQADSLVEDATQKAARLDYESRNNADRVTREAQQRADALDGEVAAKRKELFAALESERDSLAKRLSQLRGFESDYRTSITTHLENQLHSLKELHLTPQGDANTPRIDALLSGDND